MLMAPPVDLKVVTGMLQMHRLRRATEDSNPFHGLPWGLDSPRLPPNTPWSAQTVRPDQRISETSQILFEMRFKPPSCAANAQVLAAQFFGSFDERTLGPLPGWPIGWRSIRRALIAGDWRPDPFCPCLLRHRPNARLFEQNGKISVPKKAAFMSRQLCNWQMQGTSKSVEYFLSFRAGLSSRQIWFYQSR